MNFRGLEGQGYIGNQSSREKWGSKTRHTFSPRPAKMEAWSVWVSDGAKRPSHSRLPHLPPMSSAVWLELIESASVESFKGRHSRREVLDAVLRYISYQKQT
ncbi:hypothetical protein BaRGS_00020141 [Batillaria attramentaria]|uniref:Uncharacterized protein n=1 Tax=Batillaria attramentaria TaxID=370345 RepID=A0ABD0KNR9_9CAEN